jgi:hypothetical protein
MDAGGVNFDHWNDRETLPGQGGFKEINYGIHIPICISYENDQNPFYGSHYLFTFFLLGRGDTYED